MVKIDQPPITQQRPMCVQRAEDPFLSYNVA